jgi:hypothetical protein
MYQVLTQICHAEKQKVDMNKPHDEHLSIGGLTDRIRPIERYEYGRRRKYGAGMQNGANAAVPQK